MANWYVLGFLMFSLLTAGAAFGQESNNSCDKHLQESAVDSYVNLVNLYVERQPQQLSAITEAISNSEEFINPFSGIDTFTKQMAAGIERLRERLAPQDWVQVKSRIIVNQQSQVAIQATKKFAQHEASYLYSPKVVSEVQLPEDRGWSTPVHFMQNGRSFVLVSTGANALFLFEIKEGQVLFLKEYAFKEWFRARHLSILVHNNQVFVYLSANVNVGTDVMIMEFKDLEFIRLADRHFSGDVDVRNSWLQDGQLYITVESHKDFSIFRLEKSYFKLKYELKLVHSVGDDKIEVSKFQMFTSNGKAHISYFASDSSPTSLKGKFVLEVLSDKKHFETLASTDVFITSSVVTFEVSNERYFALGAHNSQTKRNTLQVYKLDGRKLHFIDEIETEHNIIKISRLPGPRISFVVGASHTLLRINFEEGRLSQAAYYDQNTLVGYYSALFTNGMRHFLYYVSSRGTDKFEHNMIEVTDTDFAPAMNLQLNSRTQYVPLPSDSKELTIFAIEERRAQLIQMVWPNKKLDGRADVQ